MSKVYALKGSLRWFARFFAVLVLVGCAQSVYAQTYFDFTCTGCGGTSASGEVTTSLVSPGEYLVTALSGAQDGDAMTLLAPGGYAGNDNLLFTPPPSLDVDGLSFSILSGSILYNIYYDSGLGEYLECNSVDDGGCETGAGTVVQFSLTPAPSPEPGTLVLFGSGLLLLGAMLRRKLFAKGALPTVSGLLS